MRTLHIDFETDGLNVPGQPSDHPDQPRALSVAAILDDAEGNEIETFSTLVRPTRPVSDEVFRIHGISFEKADAEGIANEQAVIRLVTMMDQCDAIVAFNAFFDLKCFKVACALFADPIAGDAARRVMETKSAICTMDGARKHLKAGRFIKLIDAHERLFGEGFTGAHGSLADAQASRRIFHELRRIGATLEAKSLTRKVYATPLPDREAVTA